MPKGHFVAPVAPPSYYFVPVVAFAAFAVLVVASSVVASTVVASLASASAVASSAVALALNHPSLVASSARNLLVALVALGN